MKVDGITRSDPRFGVGLFDVVEIGGKHYRFIPSKVPTFIEIPKEESAKKICKISDKTAVKKGKIQLNLHDGKNIVLDKNEYSTKDSLIIELPSQKILEHIKFEPESMVMIISGKYTGRLAILKKIETGINKRVWLDMEGKSFEAPLDAVVMVGKSEPVMKLGE